MSTDQPMNNGPDLDIADLLGIDDASFDDLRDPFPAHLVALAAGGLVTEDEAGLLLGHEPSRRKLARSFEEEPPSTPIIADMLLHNRTGAVRLVEELHLDTGSARAIQSRRRIDEIRSLSEHKPVLAWMAQSHGGYFLSFDAFGRQISHPLDSNADVVDAAESWTIRAYALRGSGRFPTEMTLETAQRKRVACMVFVYRRAKSESFGTLAAVTSPVLLDFEQDPPTAVTYTLDIPASEIATLRLFVGSADSFSSLFEAPTPRLLTTRAEPTLPGTRPVFRRQPPSPSRPTWAPARDKRK